MNTYPLRFTKYSTCRALIVFAVLALFILSITTQALAQTPNASDTGAQPTRNTAVTVPVNRNVYSAGGSVRSSGVVEGDFIAAGGRIVLDHAVKGDAMLAGGSVDVRAPVGDDLRTAGGDINIDSTIGGELYAAAGNITLTKNAQVTNATTLYAGSATIEGKLDGPLKVSAQKIVLNGEVNSDVRLVAEQIELGPNAKILGTLSYAASNELKKADGAAVAGAITREERRAERRSNDRNSNWEMNMQHRGPSWLGSVFTFLALLACAAIFLLVFPRFSTRAAETIKTSAWLGLAVGLGAVLGVPLLAILLFITLLGIPLGIAVIALYPALLLMGYLVSVLFIAQRAQLAMRKDMAHSFSMSMAFFALSLLLVMLLGRLPFVGSLFIFIITIIGVGASVLELYQRHKSGTTPAAPLASSSGPSTTGSAASLSALNI